mmetsp:Transcript_94259/g.275670  ORF Transcript_94259/g.275670 Transcript_94259/m.275670 type:complete len:82 (-) Transcript_94259:990-1235(-)
MVTSARCLASPAHDEALPLPAGVPTGSRALELPSESAPSLASSADDAAQPLPAGVLTGSRALELPSESGEGLRPELGEGLP